MPVADALDLGPVGGRRHDHTAGALHRLADEGGDLAGADLRDLLLQPAGGDEAELLAAEVLRRAVAMGPVVRLVDVGDARNGQACLPVHGGHAAQGRRRDRGAVIGVAPRDDHLAVRLPHQVPVTTHHPDDGVIGFRARAAEEDVPELRRRHRGQPLGESSGRRRRGLEEGVVVGQGPHLLRGGLDESLLAIADVHAPQPRHGVEDPPAIAVPHVHALAARDHAHPLGGERLVIRERVQEVRRIRRLPLLGAASRERRQVRPEGRRAGCHGGSPGQTWSSRCSRSQGEITLMNSSCSRSLISVYTVRNSLPRTSARSCSARSSDTASPRLRGSSNALW